MYVQSKEKPGTSRTAKSGKEFDIVDTASDDPEAEHNPDGKKNANIFGLSGDESQ